ncbi:7950_t:CDS:10, partial [Acaulospora colombiana]
TPNSMETTGFLGSLPTTFHLYPSCSSSLVVLSSNNTTMAALSTMYGAWQHEADFEFERSVHPWCLALPCRKIMPGKGSKKDNEDSTVLSSEEHDDATSNRKAASKRHKTKEPTPAPAHPRSRRNTPAPSSERQGPVTRSSSVTRELAPIGRGSKGNKETPKPRPGRSRKDAPTPLSVQRDATPMEEEVLRMNIDDIDDIDDRLSPIEESNEERAMEHDNDDDIEPVMEEPAFAPTPNTDIEEHPQNVRSSAPPNLSPSRKRPHSRSPSPPNKVHHTTHRTVAGRSASVSIETSPHRRNKAFSQQQLVMPPRRPTLEGLDITSNDQPRREPYNRPSPTVSSLTKKPSSRPPNPNVKPGNTAKSHPPSTTVQRQDVPGRKGHNSNAGAPDKVIDKPTAARPTPNHRNQSQPRKDDLLSHRLDINKATPEHDRSTAIALTTEEEEPLTAKGKKRKSNRRAPDDERDPEGTTDAPIKKRHARQEPLHGTLAWFKKLGDEEGKFADLIKTCYYRLLCKKDWFPDDLERSKLTGMAYRAAADHWRQTHNEKGKDTEYITSGDSVMTQPPEDHNNGEGGEDNGDAEPNDPKDEQHKVSHGKNPKDEFADCECAQCRNLASEFRGNIVNVAIRLVVQGYGLDQPDGDMEGTDEEIIAAQVAKIIEADNFEFSKDPDNPPSADSAAGYPMTTPLLDAITLAHLSLTSSTVYSFPLLEWIAIVDLYNQTIIQDGVVCRSFAFRQIIPGSHRFMSDLARLTFFTPSKLVTDDDYKAVVPFNSNCVAVLIAATQCAFIRWETGICRRKSFLESTYSKKHAKVMEEIAETVPKNKGLWRAMLKNFEEMAEGQNARLLPKYLVTAQMKMMKTTTLMAMMLVSLITINMNDIACADTIMLQVFS